MENAKRLLLAVIFGISSIATYNFANVADTETPQVKEGITVNDRSLNEAWELSKPAEELETVKEFREAKKRNDALAAEHKAQYEELKKKYEEESRKGDEIKENVAKVRSNVEANWR